MKGGEHIGNFAGRAGRYVVQPEGYRAFVPRPLPPDPPVSVDSTLLTLLSRADGNLGKLNGATETLPNPDLFVLMYVRKEAVLSSQIEGTQSTLLDLLEFEAIGRRPDHPRDVAEVSNYVDAMNYGLDQIRRGRELSVPLIQEIHSRLLRHGRGSGHRPGELRPVQNWIGPPGGGIRGAVFIPPPVSEMHRALTDFERFLRSDKSLPPLIKVALAHSQFETIHPFLDGNGRIGRLLITFLLTIEGALERPLLYLSHYFRQHRSAYYDRLQAVRDQVDWEGWLGFFLKGVDEVSRQATETARKVVRLREDHRSQLQETLGRRAGSGLGLLEFLFERPMVTVNDVQKVTGLSFPSANDLVATLEGLGIVKEQTGQKRYRVFAYRPYLDLLLD